MEVLIGGILTLAFLPLAHLGPLMPQVQAPPTSGDGELIPEPISQVYVDGSSPRNRAPYRGSYYSRHLRNKVRPFANRVKKEDVLNIYKYEISTFGYDQTGIIIVDYLTSEPISVKWFKPAEMYGDSGTHHEVPAEGAYRYRVINLLYKGNDDIYMGQTIVEIRDIKDYEKKFRVQFSGRRMMVQKVFEIKEDIIFHRQLLENMKFLKTPPQQMIFETDDQVSLTCETKTPVGFQLSWFRGSVQYPRIYRTASYYVKWDVLYTNSYRFRDMQLRLPNIQVDVDMSHSRMTGFKIVSTLHIYKATREDQGFYVCEFADPTAPETKLWSGTEVKHRRTEKLIPLEVEVGVQGCDPQPLLEKRDIFGMNDNVETCILCRANGYPPPKVALYKDNSEVLQDERISVDAGKELIGTQEMVYTFRDPDKVDAGSYSCRASNAATKGRRDFKVVYYSRATARILGKDTRKLKRPGQVNITCEVTGSPLPTLTFFELDGDWKNGRQIIVGPGYKITFIIREKNRLRAKLWIRKAHPDKHYECKADNGLSSDYAYATLTKA